MRLALVFLALISSAVTAGLSGPPQNPAEKSPQAASIAAGKCSIAGAGYVSNVKIVCSDVPKRDIERLLRTFNEILSDEKTLNPKLDKIQSTLNSMQAEGANHASVSLHSWVRFDTPMLLDEVNRAPTRFYVGQTPRVNFLYGNGGQYPISKVQLAGALVLLPVGVEASAWWNQHAQELKMGPETGALLPTKTFQDDDFSTYALPEKLSAQDVDDLTSYPARKMLCAVAKIQWRDTTGSYETSHFSCAVSSTGDGQYQWITTPFNNAEHRLGD